MSITEQELDQRLVAARHHVLRRVHRRRRLAAATVIGAGLLVAGSGVGATIVVQQISAHDAARTVVCFSHDDLGSISAGVGQADAVDADGTEHPAGPMDKQEACALAWRSGLADEAEGRRPTVDPYWGTGDYAVPPLAFCLLRDGRTGGFPIEAPATTAVQVCDRLGLPLDGSV